jgi:hypothetical protein
VEAEEMEHHEDAAANGERNPDAFAPRGGGVTMGM